MIALEDQYKTIFITDWGAFIWVIMSYSFKNTPPTYQITISMAFREYLGIFMKLFVDNFSVFNDQNAHTQKLHLCFDKCCEFDINLNINKMLFFMCFGVIMGYIVS
jgi:hypothetical protein